jgi:hypothetical protein
LPVGSGTLIRLSPSACTPTRFRSVTVPPPSCLAPGLHCRRPIRSKGVHNRRAYSCGSVETPQPRDKLSARPRADPSSKQGRCPGTTCRSSRTAFRAGEHPRRDPPPSCVAIPLTSAVVSGGPYTVFDESRGPQLRHLAGMAGAGLSGMPTTQIVPAAARTYYGLGGTL